jgi:hypothetical protein
VTKSKKGLRGNPVETLLAFFVVFVLPPITPQPHNTSQQVFVVVVVNHKRYHQRFILPHSLASARWQKEIQRVIAVSAWDQITGKNETTIYHAMQ